MTSNIDNCRLRNGFDISENKFSKMTAELISALKSLTDSAQACAAPIRDSMSKSGRDKAWRAVGKDFSLESRPPALWRGCLVVVGVLSAIRQP